MSNKNRSIPEHRIHPKLRRKLRIFLAIYAVMTVIVVYDMLRDHIDPLWAVGGFVAGLVLGVVLTRMDVLSWNSDAKVVVGRMDLIGALLLVAYLVFIVFRDDVLGTWIRDSNAVAVTGISMTAGTMAGRVFHTFNGIRGILREAGVLPDAE